jgi:hypothetical protein
VIIDVFSNERTLIQFTFSMECSRSRSFISSSWMEIGVAFWRGGWDSKCIVKHVRVVLSK